MIDRGPCLQLDDVLTEGGKNGLTSEQLTLAISIWKLNAKISFWIPLKSPRTEDSWDRYYKISKPGELLCLRPTSLPEEDLIRPPGGNTDTRPSELA